MPESAVMLAINAAIALVLAGTTVVHRSRVETQQPSTVTNPQALPDPVLALVLQYAFFANQTEITLGPELAAVAQRYSKGFVSCAFFVFTNPRSKTNSWYCGSRMTTRVPTALEGKPYRHDVRGWYYAVPDSERDGRLRYRNHVHPEFEIAYKPREMNESDYGWVLSRGGVVIIRDASHGPNGNYKGVHPNGVAWGSCGQSPKDITIYTTTEFEKLTENGGYDFSKLKCYECPGELFHRERVTVTPDGRVGDFIHTWHEPSEKPLQGKGVAYRQNGVTLCQQCWEEVTRAMAR